MTHTAARGRDADFAPPPTTEDEAVPKIDSLALAANTLIDYHA